MIRRANVLTVLLALVTGWGCTLPIPPGTRVAIVYPRDGAVVDPDTTLLVHALAWGPGFFQQFWDQEHLYLPWKAVPVRVRIDDRPGSRGGMGAYQRIPMRLTPGPHTITVRSPFGWDRIHVTVPAAPAFRFEPIKLRDIRAGRDVPHAVAEVVHAYQGQSRGPIYEQRMVASPVGVLAALLHDRELHIWVLSRDPVRAAQQMRQGPLVRLAMPAGTYTIQGVAIAACAEAFVVVRNQPDREALQIVFLTPDGVRSTDRIPYATIRTHARSADLRMDRDVLVHTFPGDVRCYDGRLILTQAEDPGNPRLHILYRPGSAIQAFSAPGEVLLLDDTLMQLHACGLSPLGGGPTWALPLPPQPAAWSGTHPLQPPEVHCHIEATQPLVVQVTDGGPDGGHHLRIRLRPAALAEAAGPAATPPVNP